MEINTTEISDEFSAHKPTQEHIDHSLKEDSEMALDGEDELNENASVSDKSIDTSVLQSLKHPKCNGDVELLESTLTAWKNQNSDNDVMEREIKQQRNLNEMIKKNANERIVDLEKSIEMLQKNIDALHSDLHWIDDLHKEIEEVKEKNSELDAQLLTEREDSERKDKENGETITKLKQLHFREIEQIKAVMDMQLERVNTEYKLKLGNQQTEIEGLREQLHRVEKEKQSEISVLKLEYENKLRKLQQKKNAMPVNQQQQSSFNQEIYRRKLQHLKTEYEQENTALKNQVRILQQQLNVKCVGRKSVAK